MDRGDRPRWALGGSASSRRSATVLGVVILVGILAFPAVAALPGGHASGLAFPIPFADVHRPASGLSEPGAPVVNGSGASVPPASSPIGSPPSSGPSPPAGGGLTRYFVHIWEVDWVFLNSSEITSTPGVNVSQGSSFTVSVTLGCPRGLPVCNGTATVAQHGALAAGNYPSWVAPCGAYWVGFNVTGSNLPLTIPPGGTVTIRLTLLAPLVFWGNPSYPSTYGQFNYTARLDIALTF